jgi:hypothetical protein
MNRLSPSFRFPFLSASALALVSVTGILGSACSDDPSAKPASVDGGPGATGDAQASNADSGAGDAQSGNDGSASGGYTEAQYCADHGARTTKCNVEAAELTCAEEYGCLQKLRPEAREGLARCLTGRACDKSEDSCFTDAAAAFKAETGTYVNDCLAKRDSCSEDPYPDDFCVDAIALGGATVIAGVKACLEKPCADVAACFLAAVAPMSCK